MSGACDRQRSRRRAWRRSAPSRTDRTGSFRCARIRDRRRRPVVGVLVDARDLDRELCREVVVVIRVPGFDTADLRAQLLRGAVQSGTAERVRGVPLNPLISAEVRVAASTAPARTTAGKSPGDPPRPWKSPRPPGPPGPPGPKPAWASWTAAALEVRIAFEPAGEVARIEVGWQEIGATPIVQRSAIDACRFTGDGKRVGQRFGAEAERRQRRGILSRLEHAGIQGTSGRVLVDRQ